jgi:glycosyltransferase involved in cell wall biosynthesis
MSIVVILCTYNRCDALVNALNSVAGSEVPDQIRWEVLVVDNNSTDRTREVVEEFSQKYPGRFRYVKEPQQGVSYARNRGIIESSGDIVAFMDDDVTVDPLWLWNLTKSLYSGEWAGVGGRIFPLWESAPPRWLNVDEPHALGPFVAFDRGPQAAQLEDPPFGANMAFRRETFERHGGFRTDLGRCADNLLGNEDSDYGRRLLSAGERLRYEPTAVMWHPVTKNRLTKRYLLAWWFGKGRSDVVEIGLPEKRYLWLFDGIPLYLVRRLVAWAVRWVVASGAKRRFSCERQLWNVAGQIAGCRKMASETKAPHSVVEGRRAR